MEAPKSVIVYYGERTAPIDNPFSPENENQSSQEIFVVQEHHRDEVPHEYYDHPEEYYRLKFKQRGYDVTLRPYPEA